jgi:DNA (cytosine-5)-methyltransferase 1
MSLTFGDYLCGIGGCRLAFEQAGYRCVWACEKNEACRKTYRMNFGDMPAGDIAGVDPGEVPDHDVSVAGLPCTPFSVAGRKGGLDDRRAGVFHSVLRVLAAKRPRVVIQENVPALARQAGGRTLNFYLGCLRGLGFTVAWRVLDASSFGAAQRRKRLFIVGTRGTRFDFDAIPVRPPARLRDILDDVDEGWLGPASTRCSTRQGTGHRG